MQPYLQPPPHSPSKDFQVLKGKFSYKIQDPNYYLHMKKPIQWNGILLIGWINQCRLNQFQSRIIMKLIILMVDQQQLVHRWVIMGKQYKLNLKILQIWNGRVIKHNLVWKLNQGRLIMSNHSKLDQEFIIKLMLDLFKMKIGTLQQKVCQLPSLKNSNQRILISIQLSISKLMPNSTEMQRK